ncbi:hypothetical protein SEA_LINETTI_85 [Gordonia phage Linetti]|nr:hypothetical protein SEA_LINETTI_85 [Gordonia phage Linetti]
MGMFMPEPVGDDPENMKWSNKWSASVGEMKAALENVPDDYEIVLENADVDDLNIAELRIGHLFPPTPHGNNGLVVLSQGQVISAEYDYENRHDTFLEYPQSGVMRWDEAKKIWRST